ncbi:MAG TPA: DUF151 domain-containing protein [Bacteroidales bacterium]|jgi:hypothetical protein|nr:DUF151 domain-containing protein [Bacteroidales bacterium]MDY0160912.1 DUF151 domain-containing protein [Bacteroidales bacterium]HRW20394.1 DUF151 domain-containing protein [Bacteroidales bacterium]HXK80596.1 DUF151 domain-containing protein [Bacteroidales bacterium]
MKKVRLSVLGLSYSQTQAGAYALILSVEGSDHRIPIIIGSFEAQAIAIQLEEIITARPLTHDLFLSFAKIAGATLDEVIIYKLEEGVFFSRLLLNINDKTEVIESRTSDAVALALRFKCPIYTTDEIVEKAGIILKISEEEEHEKKVEQKVKKKSRPKKEKDLHSLNLRELNKIMDEAIKNEDYEKAAHIKEIINQRKK